MLNAIDQSKVTRYFHINDKLFQYGVWVEKLIFYSNKKCKIRFERKQQQQQQQQQRNNTWTKVVCNYESPLRIFFRITSFLFLVRKGKCGLLSLSLFNSHTLSFFSPWISVYIRGTTQHYMATKERVWMCVWVCERVRVNFKTNVVTFLTVELAAGALAYMRCTAFLIESTECVCVCLCQR